MTKYSCLVILAAAAVFAVDFINARPAERCKRHGSDPTLEFYSFDGAPYVRIRSGRINLKGHGRFDVTQSLKNLENAYKEMQNLIKKQQANWELLRQINKKIAVQEKITKELKQQQKSQGFDNQHITILLQAEEEKLQQLLQNKETVEQDLKQLEALLSQDIQAANNMKEQRTKTASDDSSEENMQRTTDDSSEENVQRAVVDSSEEFFGRAAAKPAPSKLRVIAKKSTNAVVKENPNVKANPEFDSEEAKNRISVWEKTNQPADESEETVNTKSVLKTNRNSVKAHLSVMPDKKASDMEENVNAKEANLVPEQNSNQPEPERMVHAREEAVHPVQQENMSETKNRIVPLANQDASESQEVNQLKQQIVRMQTSIDKLEAALNDLLNK